MPREPYHEIGELLRTHQPDPRPSPGLESRIVQSLRTPEPAIPNRNWLWFLLPPAVAAGIVLMWPQPAPKPAISLNDPAPSVVVAETSDTGQNALERESAALRNDARRAGRFLINCLPGLTDPVK
jgi:hypothetical protein